MSATKTVSKVRREVRTQEYYIYFWRCDTCGAECEGHHHPDEAECDACFVARKEREFDEAYAGVVGGVVTAVIQDKSNGFDNDVDHLIISRNGKRWRVAADGVLQVYPVE